MKKITSLILSFILVFSLTVEVLANNVDSKKNELGKVEQNIDGARDELNRVSQQQKSISAQLSSIDTELVQKQDELKKVEAQLSATQNNLKKTTDELNDAEKKLTETQEELESTKLELELAILEAEIQEAQIAARLRAMYINSSSSYLELLFESKSINELLNKMAMIKQLITYDQEVFNDMEQFRDEVQLKKAVQEEQEQLILDYRDEIENNKIALEQQEKNILNTKNKIASQKSDIESKMKQRQVLYSQLDKEKAAINKELDELERLSKELEKTIQDLIRKQQQEASRGAYNGGALAWPVPGFEGRITSPFGMRRHPITGLNRLHTGIDIAGFGINDKPAVAAADGVIIMAQWYGGYGNTVLIDHGSGIVTLYAHGKSIPVTVGQSVKRGQTVLRVGTTGQSTGPHLHFEVRLNGTPVNPMTYFR